MKNNWLKLKHWIQSHPEEILVGSLVASVTVITYTLLQADHVNKDAKDFRGQILDALYTGPIFAIATDGNKLYAVEVTEQMHEFTEQQRIR